MSLYFSLFFALCSNSSVLTICNFLALILYLSSNYNCLLHPPPPPSCSYTSFFFPISANFWDISASNVLQLLLTLFVLVQL